LIEYSSRWLTHTLSFSLDHHQPLLHTQTGEEYPVPEIAEEAKYITVTKPSKAMYCRLVVPNPTFMG
jgi:hypothetical protein